MERKIAEKAIIEALSGNAVFGGCSPQILREAARRGSMKSFNCGSVVFDSELFEPAFGVVVSGRLRVSRIDCGRVIPLNVLEKGGSFGVSALFGGSGESFSTSIEAASEAEVLFISEPAMLELLKKQSVSLGYISFLTERIRFLNAKLRSFTSGSSLERLAGALISSADGSGKCVISSYSGLAQELNMGRASLYRSIEELESRGIISRDGKTVFITDINALADVK